MPVAQLASVGVRHPEALVLVCTTICSSHFSSVSGAILEENCVQGEASGFCAHAESIAAERASAPRALALSSRVGFLLINGT